MTATDVGSTATFAGQPVTTQFIGGRWREGCSEGVLTDTNPFDGSVVATIRQASAEDVDEAYTSAEAAQKAWGAKGPAERAAVIRRAAEILDERRGEIVDWLVAESGSTRIKADTEVSLAVAIT